MHFELGRLVFYVLNNNTKLRLRYGSTPRNFLENIVKVNKM